jgi:diacylglycerol kinase family enzyme
MPAAAPAPRTPARSRRRFLLVENPTAGRGANPLAARVLASLRARGATLIKLEEAGGADADALLAVGGDGTVRALVPEAVRRGLPVGLVPAGTGNVLAHEIACPRTPEALADLLVDGPAVAIETARANGVPFLLMAGAGFDGHVIARLDTSLKQRVGKAAYCAPVLRALAGTPAALSLTLDGVSYEASWAILTRACCYGGAFRLAPAANLLQPGFVAVLFHGASRARRFAQLMGLARGRLALRGDVTMVPCRRATVRCATPVPVEVDGDPFGTTPLDVEMGGPKLTLIVPPAYAAGA